MPTYCDGCIKDKIYCCDFCKHYDFRGDENGAYTGDGWCNLHTKQIDPEDECDDFYCFKADENPVKGEANETNSRN